MLCFHKWSKWVTGIGTYDSPLFPKLGTWKEPIQVRTCAKCKRIDVRKVG